ncbi:MAG: hypothetical protein EA398_14250 [Deltaproteobacteria bacterium]|nr:MAG: hypothetical protein EA398_14250 [Deltaproteobacteria bacterium]
MGNVWEAHRELEGPSGRPLALKIVRSRRSGQVHAIEHEIRLLSRLDHPGIVPVLDFGIVDGIPWYVMPRIDGVPLDQWLGRIAPGPEGQVSTVRLGPGYAPEARWDPEVTTASLQDAGERTLGDGKPLEHPDAFRRLAELVVRLCDALQYIHVRGLVHRDLKPANILVTPDDQPILVDFGLGEEGADAGRDVVDEYRHAHGTPGFVAPEVLRGAAPDARADLFSLGVVLYEAISGTLPWASGAATRLLAAQTAPDPTPLRLLAPGVPPALATLVHDLLEITPARRPAYATDVARTLIESKLASPVRLRGEFFLHRPRLVGREQFMQQVDEALDEVRDGQTVQLLLSSASGGGKTRCALELVRASGRQGFRTLTIAAGANGEARDQDAPWESLTAILVRLRLLLVTVDDDLRHALLDGGCRAMSVLLPELGALGPHANGYLSDDERDAFERILATELESLLRNIADLNPLLIVIDDLQWVDAASARVLRRILERLQQRPMRGLFAATVNDEGVSSSIEALLGEVPWRPLHLEPLDSRQTAAVLQDMLGALALPRSVVDLVDEVAQGSPYLVAVSARALVDERVLRRSGTHRWSIDEKRLASIRENFVPGALVDLVSGRLDRLDPFVRRVLVTAAIAGQSVSPSMLAGVLKVPQPDVERAIDTLRMDGWLALSRIEGGVSFTFGRTRDAILRTLAPAQRASLHHAFAKALGQFPSPGPHDAERAGHLEAILDTDAAREAWIAAAIHASRQGAPTEAETAWRRAAQLADDPRTRLALLLSALEDGPCRDNRFDACREELEQLREDVDSSGDPSLQARAALLEVTVLDSLGEHARLPDALARALELTAKTEDPELRQRALHMEGIVALRTGSPHDAARHLARATRMARRHGLVEAEGRALAEWALARRFSVQRLGEFPGLFDIARDLERAGRLGAAARAYRYAVPALVAGGFIDLADAAIERARSLMQEQGVPQLEANLGLIDGQIAHARGHFTRARRFTERHLRFQKDSGNVLGVHFARGSLAMIARSAGHYAVAERLARHTIPFFEDRDVPHGVAHLAPVHAAALIALGAIEQADALAARAEQVARQEEHPMPETEARLLRVRAARLGGDPLRAQALLAERRTLEIAPALAVQVAAEEVHLVLALGQNVDPARHHLEQTVASATGLGFYETLPLLERARAAARAAASGRLIVHGEFPGALPAQLRQRIARSHNGR